MALSFSERVFVRHIALLCSRLKKDCKRELVEEAIIEANDNNAVIVTDEMYKAARNVVKFRVAKPSNPYFFVPSAFKSKVVRGAVKGEVLNSFMDYLAWVEDNVQAVNMSDTLVQADSPLYYLDKDNEAVSTVSNIVTSEYVEFETKPNVVDVFNKFVSKDKVPSVISYLIYEPGKKCGLVEHTDVDATFFSCILMIKDSVRGRLIIPDNGELSEPLEAGNCIYMDPRVLHSVTYHAREEKRKVVVFTV